MVIEDAIVQAIDPLLSFFLHQQVEELEVILVEIQGYLAGLACQDKVHEVDQKVQEALDEKEHQITKEVKFGGDVELVSSPLSFSGVKCGS